MSKNTKENLYNFVDELRYDYGIPLFGKPINVLDFINSLSMFDVIFHRFDTNGFCGAAFAGKIKNTIILNSNRSAIEQNFDCAHEFIHLSKHRGKNDGIFKCFESDQNSFLEWQANEGAAQFIVPYQDFIPRFLSCLDFRHIWGNYTIENKNIAIIRRKLKKGSTNRPNIIRSKKLLFGC